MEELQLFRGDTVLLKGKKGKATVCLSPLLLWCSDYATTHLISFQLFICLFRCCAYLSIFLGGTSHQQHACDSAHTVPGPWPWPYL